MDFEVEQVDFFPDVEADANHKTSAERTREKKTEWESNKRKSLREIDAIPPCVNPTRRDACALDLALFITTYHAQEAYYSIPEWEREAIARIQSIVFNAGQMAMAIPREFGKTTLALFSIEWALLYGHKRYIYIVAKKSDAALKILRRFDAHILKNNLYAEDFPEVVYPIRSFDGNAQKAQHIRYNNVNYPARWSGSDRQFPDIPGCICGASALRAQGIESSIKGANVDGRDGLSMRPDMILIDDPQDAKVAASPALCKKYINSINSDILPLGSTIAPLAIIATVTVVRQGDVSDYLTTSPAWQHIRFPAMLSWPDHDTAPYWSEYRKLYIADLDAGAADMPTSYAYYREHQADLERGALAAWPEKFERGKLSAIHWLCDLRWRMLQNPDHIDLFESEYQQSYAESQARLEPEQVLAKTYGIAGRVPEWCTRIVAGADLNPRTRGIVWAVWAYDDSLRGRMLDAGKYPPDDDEVLWSDDCTRGMTEDQAITWGIKQVYAELMAKTYTTDDGTIRTIDGVCIDASYHYVTVTKTCAQLGRKCIPIRGRAHNKYKVPSQSELRAGRTLDFDFARADAIESYVQDAAGTIKRQIAIIMHVDTCMTKQRVMQGFLRDDGAGAMTISGSPDAPMQKMVAKELSSEYIFRHIKDDKGEKYEWIHLPDRNNEMLDSTVYAMAGAMFAGANPFAVETFFDTSTPTAPMRADPEPEPIKIDKPLTAVTNTNSLKRTAVFRLL